MNKFTESFQLDFISKTFMSSAFQGLLAAGMIFQSRSLELHRIWVVLGLGIVIVAQVFRCSIFLMYKSSNTKLLSFFTQFSVFSLLTAAGWGGAAFAALISVGSQGIGLTSLMACAAIACATAYAAAAALTVQRIYTLIILIPPAMGLAIFTHPNSDWTTVSLLAFVLFYCIVLAQKQNETMQKLFEQQERIKADLQAAREIQQSLLPKRDQQFGNFQIEVLYKPCEDLSGDFFEVQPIKNNLLFYVADVTSHGTASAQVTFLLKGIFKKILPADHEGIDLKALTRQLAIEYSSYGLTYSVSLFMGCLDITTGQIEFISSNFPDPLMMGDEAALTVDAGLNPVIDAMNTANEYNFNSDRVAVLKGYSLFVFTDGTYELKGDGAGSHRQNYRRLSKVLEQGANSNWKESVLSELSQMNGSENFQDDITIMKIKHLPT